MFKIFIFIFSHRVWSCGIKLFEGVRRIFQVTTNNYYNRGLHYLFFLLFTSVKINSLGDCLCNLGRFRNCTDHSDFNRCLQTIFGYSGSNRNFSNRCRSFSNEFLFKIDDILTKVCIPQSIKKSLVLAEPMFVACLTASGFP